MTGQAMTRTRLQERLVQAQTDVTELASQVEAGEIDSDTAAKLEAAYREEISSIEAELDTLPDSGLEGRSTRRVLAGAAFFISAVVIIVILATQFVVPRDSGFATGAASEVIDPDSISSEALEAVIGANADHPQVNGMRMALADRYFAAGDFRAALPHYQAILESDADTLEAPIALARVGWMFYQSGGEPEVAADYLNESLARAPGYEEAQLYLASVYLYGLDNRKGAFALLSELASRTDLSPEIAEIVSQLMADAQDAP